MNIDKVTGELDLVEGHAFGSVTILETVARLEGHAPVGFGPALLARGDREEERGGEKRDEEMRHVTHCGDGSKGDC